jgi:hypothetical protein
MVTVYWFVFGALLGGGLVVVCDTIKLAGEVGVVGEAIGVGDKVPEPAPPGPPPIVVPPLT